MFKNLKNRKDFLDFLERYPEITISIDNKYGGYIVNFPEGAESTSYTYFLDTITLSCIYNGEIISFPDDVKIYKIRRKNN